MLPKEIFYDFSGNFLFFFGKLYINKENFMNRLYEIVNYSNNHLFDLYEINEKRQKYKRFRIQKPELMKLLSPNEASALEKGTLQFATMSERVLQEKAMIIF